MREVQFKTCKLNLKLESRMCQECGIQNFHFSVKCQIQNLDVKFKTSMLDIKLRCRLRKSRLKFETWMLNSDVEFWRR